MIGDFQTDLKLGTGSTTGHFLSVHHWSIPQFPRGIYMLDLSKLLRRNLSHFGTKRR
jgi:hypothetical protein